MADSLAFTRTGVWRTCWITSSALGADALDPIEPPPQGDVELSYVRQRYGGQLVLFGNLEIADHRTVTADIVRGKGQAGAARRLQRWRAAALS